MTNSPTSQVSLEQTDQLEQRLARFRKAINPWMKPKIIMGGILVLLLVFMGILAPALSPYDPNLQDLSKTLQAPGWWGSAHFLGTDHVGRDCLSRIFYGARISLVVVAVTLGVGLVIGVIAGLLAGWYGR